MKKKSETDDSGSPTAVLFPRNFYLLFEPCLTIFFNQVKYHSFREHVTLTLSNNWILSWDWRGVRVL